MAKAAFKPQRAMYSKVFTYDYWMESTGIPIRRGYYVEDLRKLELGWWEERLCMSAIPDPDFFFNNSHPTLVNLSEEELYSEAKMIQQSAESNPYGRTVFWYGNFFPDMRAWDKLDSNARRGAGGRSVSIMFPNS